MQREKIKNLLRNNYYYNNISMAQDIKKAIKAFEKERQTIDGKEEDPERVAKKLREIQEKVEIMKKQSRFPLTDLQKESEQYIQEVRTKYGAVRHMEREIS